MANKMNLNVTFTGVGIGFDFSHRGETKGNHTIRRQQMTIPILTLTQIEGTKTESFRNRELDAKWVASEVVPLTLAPTLIKVGSIRGCAKVTNPNTYTDTNTKH